MILPFMMALGMSTFILCTHTDIDVEEMRRRQEMDMLTRQSSSMRKIMDNAKSNETKIMIGSLSKITIYYEQVSDDDVML